MKRGHAQVRGISIYYEMHGQGQGTPLVLLHGGGSSVDVTFGRALPFLARERLVIALDEQNHGRSGHRDVPERFTDSADDVAALLGQLGVQNADVLGFSNGASVALQVAIRHRALVRKLVFISSLTKRSGAPEQFWEAMRKGTYEDMPQVLKDAFLKVNPDPALLRDMYNKDSERMVNFVETSDDDVRSVAVPTLILAADRDVGTSEHAVELSRLLPNARLTILPGSHGECLGELSDAPASAAASPYPEVTTRLIGAFLGAP
jgi:pimeloyl-ACP methyl ester carboxylesterase